MDIKIRRQFLMDHAKDKSVIKAVALSLYVKAKYHRTSSVPNYTINRLHEITHLHATTLRKRMKTLFQLNLAHHEGQMVVFGTLKSSRDYKNIKIKVDETDSVKNLEDKIYAVILTAYIARKEYIGRLLHDLHDGKTAGDIKRARQIIRKYGQKWKIAPNTAFNDFGFSYNGIAHKLGVGASKAVKTVKYAITQGWITKENNRIRKFMPLAEKFSELINNNGQFTYVFGNYAYIVQANTYSLTASPYTPAAPW